MTTTPARTLGRSEAIDRVKGVAIVAVVATHAGVPLWTPDWATLDPWLRLTWNIFNVPAFFMVAGTLYRTTIPMTAAVIRRRIVRLVVPYLVVSASLLAAGVMPWPHDLLFAMLTGGTSGPYYFVPLLLLCIGFGAMLSRLSVSTIRLILAVMTAAFVVMTVTPRFALTRDLYWHVRDPFVEFAFGYFICGWLGIPERLGAHIPRAVLLIAALALLPVWAADMHDVPVRAVYSILAVAWLWDARWTFPSMRFLSEMSLAIFLLHAPVVQALTLRTIGWPTLPRVVVVTACGLVLPALGCLFARRLLGPARARRWLGA